MAARKTVEVTVREGAVVYHDGRAHPAGQVLRVTPDEARSLAEQGVLVDGDDGGPLVAVVPR